MGLIIKGYSQIKLTDFSITEHGDIADADGRIQKDAFCAMVLKEFEAYAPDLNNSCIYSYEERYKTSVGTCRGFNDWRNELAKICGYEPVVNMDESRKYLHGAWNTEKGDFWHLLNFTDNEGCIGPAVSALIYQEFIKFDSVAKNHKDGHFFGGDFYSIYESFKFAFELAAQNGAVEYN